MVDIIVPVYGNLQVLKPCIEAVFRRTYWPFRLTIVDDASDSETQAWIKDISEKNPAIQYLQNNRNRGFAATVNRGIRATSNGYVCVLNSDVLVTPQWLMKMLLALNADPKNMIVNPVTNNTAEINVPLQEGCSYLDMNRGLESVSSHQYPEIMPTGFCMMFPRQLVKEIGYLDEGYVSFGEETAYWMETITYLKNGEYPRWRAVLADDTYVFHERGTSFSSLGDVEHMAKRQAGSQRFKRLWPQYKDWRNNFNLEQSIGPVRMEMPKIVLQNSKTKYNVAFVVHSASYCGGMRYIADIVNVMNEQDINAKVVLVHREPKKKTEILGELRSAPIIFQSPIEAIEKFSEEVFSNGIVVAASNELVPIVSSITQSEPDLTSVLFAQSADPLIAPDKNTAKALLQTYGMVDCTITVSSFLDNYIKAQGVTPIGYVNPGVDTNLFYARDRSLGDDRPTLLMSLNNSGPFRGVSRGIDLAKAVLALAHRNNEEVRVMAYGVTSVKDCTEIIGLGPLSQSRIANLLGTEVDVFCDPSYVHSYGLPALEALASGCNVVSWDNGGVRDYLKHEENGLLFAEHAPVETVASAIYDLLQSKQRGKNPAALHRFSSVKAFIELLERGLSLYNPSRKINIITPHLRKHGGPTTIVDIANSLSAFGHQVNLYTIHTDINPEIVETIKVPLRVDWQNLSPCDVLICNSDNEQANLFANHPNAKKKVMLKLSHNPRFKVLEENGLKEKWDTIITSSNWLKQVCEKPLEDWNHPPHPATRVGWVHYGHSTFNCSLENKPERPKIVINTLIHAHPLKGTSISLAAMKGVKEKRMNEIHMVGMGEWPKFKEDCPNWLQYMFELTRPQFAQAMSQTDIWVSSSLSEGLGRMALEAMSASCAVIMSDTGAEYAVDGENCLIVPPNDPEAVEAAINILIEDPELRAKIAMGGYQTASKMADPSVYLNEVNKVIQGLF